MKKIASLDKQLADAKLWSDSIQERLFEAEDKASKSKDLLREFLYVEYCQWCNMDIEAHLAMKRDEPATYEHYVKVYEFVHGKNALEKLLKEIDR